MTLVPEFEIGVWNAWIFMVINVLPMPILMGLHKNTLSKSMKQYGEANKAAYYIEWLCWLFAFVYSIFLPLHTGSIWFYVGLPIALVGVVTYVVVIMSFVLTPIANEPATTGLYRYSRHPMYISQLVMFIGVGIASASWLFLLITIVYSALGFIKARSEEQLCIETYGNAYREYINRTPRWIGTPKK